MPKAMLYTVRGRVQGVGFRFFAYRAAQENDLNGWVRNIDDDCVEVFAEGEEENLETFHQRLLKGPPFAYVTEVVEEESAVKGLKGFRVIP